LKVSVANRNPYHSHTWLLVLASLNHIALE